MTSQTAESYKPNSATVIRILDNILPKIKHLQSLSYTEANKILNDEYFISQWKGRKKAFGSLFLNLDDKNIVKMLNYLGIELSEPKKQHEESDNDRLDFTLQSATKGEKDKEHQEAIARLLRENVKAKFPYEFFPIEQAVVKDFCIYALNNSRTIGKKHYIDVKGWIALYSKMSANEKIEFANTLIEYK
ncbi:hypothetical protein WAF17_02355 [Bernardetia sp. ABR2-2B]|uniref:hypothetical protein n=1 Tax=Bernardetia sp. ABR2-2B TaxID=3127472 RepID=UPI0030D5A131